jgi:hypothetical protein
MNKSYIILLAVAWMGLCPFFTRSVSSVSLTEEHQYLKSTGHENINFDWRLKQGEHFKLRTVIGSEVDLTRMDDDLKTFSWSVIDPEIKTALNVERHEDNLIFTGQFKGEAIQRTVSITAEPWYQALSMSLRKFNRSSYKKKKFWSIRPDTLDVHLLEIIKDGDEVIQLKSEPCQVSRIKIQLSGFKSVLWSSHYWLRKEDGLFVRYEGPSGPPGWPLTTVTLKGSCLD